MKQAACCAGHGTEDTFINIQHSERLAAAYGGDCNLVRFHGDHNSVRPQVFPSPPLVHDCHKRRAIPWHDCPSAVVCHPET